MNHTIDVLSAENLLETGSVPAAFILCLIPAAVIFFSRRFRGSTFLRRAAAVLCSVSALFLCAGYLPAAQAQDTCTWNDVNTWSGLYEAMQSDGCIKLTASVTYGTGGGEHASETLVLSGKTVTLDLNGNTIDRGLAWEAAQEGGYVISVSGTLTLTGSGTITGGKNAGNGGGVYVASKGSLTMNSGISIEYNSAENGGGVYVDGGTFTLSGGTFTGNSASSNGGGVYVYSGSFYLSGGTISDNGVTSDNSHGGGVYVYDTGTYFYLSGNPTISGNRKNGSASNLYLEGGKAITITGPLTNATPIGVGKDGSGFPITEGLSGYGTNANFKSDNSNYSINLNTAGEAEIVNRSTCTIFYKDGTDTMGSQKDLPVNQTHSLVPISNLSEKAESFVGWNTMADGTGIYYADGAPITPTGDTTLYAQWSQESAAKISGGNSYPTLRAAINAAGSGQTVELLTNINSEEKAGGWPVTVASGKNFTLDLNGKTIDRGLTGQDAREDGYVISVSGTLTLTGSGTITGGNNTGNGGGVYVASEGTFNMEDGTISGNTADYGGGVYVATESSFTMNGGTITGNSNTSSNGSGGGVYNNGTFEMTDGTISGNRAQYGGGVYVDEKATFTMEGGTIGGTDTNAANTAGFGGGGVYVYDNATFTMSNGTISQNTAAEQGGGVYNDGTFEMTGGTITGNTTTSSSGGSGGGVHNNGTFEMTNGTITGNNSSDSGGVYNRGSFTMSDGEISGNTAASGFGGGVYVLSSGTFTMEDGTISGNTAASGGGVYIMVGTFNMEGGKISGNTSQMSGGGVYNWGSFTMKGGEICQNTASSQGGGVFVDRGTVKVSGSPVISGNVKGGTISEGVLSGGTTNNVFLDSDQFITVTGQLSNSTPIGVTMNTPPGKFTNSSTIANNNIDSFSSDDPLYAVVQYTEDEDIGQLYLKKIITVSGITAENKTYDGNTNATLVYTKAVISGKAEGDDLSVTATGTFDDKNAGPDKTVTITELTLIGTDAYKYTFADSGQQSEATAAIGQKLVLAAITVEEKPYDGTTTAAVTATVNADDLVSEDNITISGLTGTFDNANAGTNKTVTINDVNKNITGTGSENYHIDIPGNVNTGVISKVGLTISANDKNIVYGEPPADNGVQYSDFVNGETEAVLGGTLTYSYSYAQYGNAGNTYTITPSGLTSVNYDIEFTPGTLTVEPKEVAVIWGSTDLTFSGAEQAPEASVADGYLVNGDSCTVTVSGQQTDAGGPYTAAAEALSNSNYTLPAGKPTTEFTIAQAAGPVLDDITISDLYTITSRTVDVSTNIPQIPENAGDLSYTVKQVSAEGAVNASADINTDGKLTFSLQNGADGDRITAVVTVSSANYMDSDVNVVLELGPKEDAEVSFEEGNSLTVTWGNSLTLHPAAANEGTNGGWTLSSSEESVAASADDGTITILTAGETTITAEYDSDTSTGSAKLLLTVEPKSIADAAVTLSETEFVYDETEKNTDVQSVVLAGVTLIRDADYEVKGDFSGTEAETYTLTITGKGNYTGSVSAEWKIVKPGFTVTWLMDDGSELGTTTVEYGEMPSHDDPVKAADTQYTWSFSSWEPALAPVKENTSYTAVFSPTVNQYTVTFVDEDGTTVLLEAKKYASGTKAADITRPEDPVKPATAGQSFTFKGWKPEIADVTEDAIYQAVYTNSTNSYTVTWKNADGTVLKTDEDVPYGTTPAYSGEDPVKAPAGGYRYTFSAWKPEPGPVTGNAEYTASFADEKYIYTVTVTTEGQGTASADTTAGEAGTKVRLSAVPAGGWLFREWQVVSGGVTIAADNTFTLGTEDAEIKAVFFDTPYTPLPANEDEPETTGNDQTYVIGSGQPRQFRIARVEENGNDSAYDRFEKALEQADSSGGQVTGGIRLIIDGQPLPPEKQPVLHQDYDYSRGSVIITLYPAYLDTLPVGEYTMEAFFEEDNGEIETFPTHLSVTEPRVVKFISIKNDGSYNTPKDIDAAEYKLTILITAGDTILRQAENVVLKVQPDEKEPKLSEEEVQFTVLGEENTLEISAASRIVITGLPKEVIGYGAEVYDAASGTTERPVQHRYALSVREARFGRSGEILVYLLWDDGSRPVEEIRVVALPEDEIGAYQLRADGTKEYLLFQTYDICMAWLGSDELCRGPERCYHK